MRNDDGGNVTAVELEPYDQEDAPFLDDPERSDESIPPASSKPSPIRTLQNARRWQVKTPSSIILVASLSKFVIVTGGLMMMMPLFRLIEDAICHVHYEDDSMDIIDEMKCKVDEVQSPLAFMLGWFGLLSAILNFLVAYPYGILSDKIGRKPVILLAYTGQAISFATTPFFFSAFTMKIRENPYILMFGSVFTLIGGGVPVLLTTFYAIAADISTENDKTAYFLYLALGVSGGALLGPLLAGLLMSAYGPWMPIYVMLISVPIVYATLLIIPETLVKDQKSPEASMTLKDHITHGIKDLSSAVQILRNINVPLVLVVFFFSNARMTAQSSTLAQYISKNFGWTLAQTSVLLSPLGVVNMIVLGVLPKLSDILTSRRFGFSIFRKDLFLTRASFLLLGVSSLLQGFSGNITLFLIALFIATLGSAESPLARATVSHFVDPAYTSRLYALIGMTEVLGSVTGGPVLAYFFDKGLQLKGVFTGLPWFYIAFLCFLTLVALLFVKPPATGGRREEEIIDSEEEDGLQPDHPIRLD